MKTLLFLYILDFSGSMYQKVDNEIKYVILKDNLRSLSFSLSVDQKKTESGLMVFGLDTKKKCEDIKYSQNSTQEISRLVDGYFPAPFSRTPLGESIRRGTDIVIKNKVKKVTIFSDGADSCGRDPCLELVKANEKLIKANYIMEMDFIGIYLKKNDPKFECFRNNTLSNIKINFKNIGEPFEIHQALVESQKKEQELRDPFGNLTVKGAPPNALFKAETRGSNQMITWMGSFYQQMKEGTYKVKSTFPGTKTVTVEIKSLKDKELYWEDFFYSTHSELIYTKPQFSLLLLPGAQTLAAHRKALPVVLEGNLKEKKISSQKLPFGEWRVQVLSPPWLKRSIQAETFFLPPDSSSPIDIIEKMPIEWAISPDSQKRWIIEILEPNEEKKSKESIEESENFSELKKREQNKIDDKKEKSPSRYYINTKDLQIPILKGSKVNWIQAAP